MEIFCGDALPISLSPDWHLRDFALQRPQKNEGFPRARCCVNGIVMRPALPATSQSLSEISLKRMERICTYVSMWIMRISSDKFNAAINRCFICVFALYVIKTSQRISQNVIYAESLLCLLLSLLCHVKKRTTALLMRLGTSALTVKITILTKHPE